MEIWKIICVYVQYIKITKLHPPAHPPTYPPTPRPPTQTTQPMCFPYSNTVILASCLISLNYGLLPCFVVFWMVFLIMLLLDGWMKSAITQWVLWALLSLWLFEISKHAGHWKYCSFICSKYRIKFSYLVGENFLSLLKGKLYINCGNVKCPFLPVYVCVLYSCGHMYVKMDAHMCLWVRRPEVDKCFPWWLSTLFMR